MFWPASEHQERLACEMTCKLGGVFALQFELDLELRNITKVDGAAVCHARSSNGGWQRHHRCCGWW